MIFWGENHPKMRVLNKKNEIFCEKCLKKLKKMKILLAKIGFIV